MSHTRKMLILIGAVTSCAISARADTLWYSGDFDGQAGYVNRFDANFASSVPIAKMFENFDVTNPLGWNITEIWSNNFNIYSFSAITQADWSIRSNMAPGSGGSILFSGTSPVTVTSTGRVYQPDPVFDPDFILPEYTILVSGLNVFLSPGEYWVNVTPYANSDVLISSSIGQNAVGVPAASDSNGLWWWSNGGHDYDNTGYGFSMGVGGPAVPEPSTFVLAVAGILGLMALRKRRRSIGSAVALLALAAFAADARQLVADVLVSENLGAPAYSASQWAEWAPGAEPDKAFDATLATAWNAGSYAMQWLEVDLQQPYDLTSLKLFVDQFPDGDTTHEVWVSNSAIQNDLSGATLIHTFSGFTSGGGGGFGNGEILHYTLPSLLSAQFVQIRTTESPSWVSWDEVQVFAVVPEPSSLALLLCGLVPVFVSVRRRMRTPTTRPPGQVVGQAFA